MTHMNAHYPHPRFSLIKGRSFLVSGSLLVSCLLSNSVSRAETGLHLYDVKRDRAIQEIRTAFTNINTTQLISEIRSNLAMLSERELAVAAEETKLVRDLSLYAALT